MSSKQNDRALNLVLAELKKRNLQECLDPFAPESRPIPKQQEILDDITGTVCRYVVSANQTGKSSLGGRECAWLFTETHPTFDRKAAWGTRPLMMLVIGKSTKIITNVLWGEKIKPFLTEGTYREVMTNGVIQSVENLENGNKIMFIPHHNPNEARAHSQSYVAQWVWLDEMPDSLPLFSELMTRVVASRGRFLATFTPLIANIGIKKLVEEADPRFSKKYKLLMLDNPVYKGREDEVLALYAKFPKDVRDARLYGEWYAGENAVYSLDPNVHIEAPQGYHPSWRHMEVIDPAASGRIGYMWFAEDPLTNQWYIVKAEYWQEKTARRILERTKKATLHLNVCKRVSDPHEAWFINEAADQGVKYDTVYNKNDRKKELIAQSQDFLNTGKIKIAPWAEVLLEELPAMQWSDSAPGKIVAASKYHTADCFQYGCDLLPAAIKLEAKPTIHQELKRKHRARVQQERTKTSNKGKISRISPRRGRRG